MECLKKFEFIFVCLLLFAPLVCASQQVAVNSRDWRGVYYGSLYARLEGVADEFFTSTAHGEVLYEFLNKSEPVLYIEGAENYYPGYETVLEEKGFSDVEVMRVSGLDLAFELAERYGAEDFVVVGDSLGYNAISIAPYAVQKGAFVLFANQGNVQEIADYLSSVSVDSLLLFGPVDEEVSSALAPLQPVILSTGNRFDDNLEIVALMQELSPQKQAMFSSGEFIEESLMGPYPVVIIGRDYPSQATLDYLDSAEFTVGVVIGNDLTGSAKIVKDETPIDSMFVKYAQGWAGSDGLFSEVRELNKFYLPSYQLSISIKRVAYNAESRELQLTLWNDGEAKAFYRSTVTIYVDGEYFASVSEPEVDSLDSGDERTISFVMDLTEALRDGSALNSESFVQYGVDSRDLTNALKESGSIEVVSDADSSLIRIGNVVYDVDAMKLSVELYNDGVEPAFADVSVLVKVNNEEESFETGSPLELLVSGEPLVVPFDLRITRESARTLWESVALVSVDYGSSSDLLLKRLSEERTVLEPSSLDLVWVALAIVAALACFFTLRHFAFGKKKKKKG